MAKKLVNLTVRLEHELKQKAEEAVADLDITISQVVRQALRALVKERNFRVTAFDRTSGVAQNFRAIDSRISEAVADLPVLKNAPFNAIHLNPGKFTEDRRKELEAKERSNTLNKATRQELKWLRAGYKYSEDGLLRPGGARYV